MAFRVSVAGFEGPFDLLLKLVMSQKVDIGSVSISAVADQYLSEVAQMKDVDLEVASDFILVASTLLDLKAAALVSTDLMWESDPEDDAEFEDLTVEEMRDVLVARLVAYRTFKMAAAALEARSETELLMHPRTIGPDPEFRDTAPDYLEGVTLGQLAGVCARFLGRRELVLLQSEHIAPKRLPLEDRVAQVDRAVRQQRRMTFDELVEDNPSVENKVVSILALLELGKRNVVNIDQPATFGVITIEAVEDDGSQYASDTGSKE